MSRDGNIAETNPDKFSSILIEKLLRVKEEHEKLERVRDTMKAMEVRHCYFYYYYYLSVVCVSMCS